MGVRRFRVSAQFLTSLFQGYGGDSMSVDPSTYLPCDARIVGSRADGDFFEIDLESAAWEPHEGCDAGAEPPLTDKPPRLICSIASS